MTSKKSLFRSWSWGLLLLCVGIGTAVASPNILKITTSYDSNGKPASLDIIGTGFQGTVNVRLGGQLLPSTAVTVVSLTELKVNIAGIAPGDQKLVVFILPYVDDSHAAVYDLTIGEVGLANVLPLCANQSNRFVDGRDGTVTDCTTGLMWEQKDLTCAAGDLHCVSNLYTWSATLGGTAADGTLYTSFLAGLNSDVSADGVSTCFANHCDWRIPNIHELQTILLAPYPCATSPCIDPVFGPTLSAIYWSSSTNTITTLWAWEIHFQDGLVIGTAGKVNSYSARAVRGGQ